MRFGLPTVLTIVFVVLKLTETINWSWIWVLSPLWIYAIIAVVSLIVIGIVEYKYAKSPQGRIDALARSTTGRGIRR